MDDSRGDAGAGGTERGEHGDGAAPARRGGGGSGERLPELTPAHLRVLEYLACCTAPASERSVRERVLGRSWVRGTAEVLRDLEAHGLAEAGPTLLRASAMPWGPEFERQTWRATDDGRSARAIYCEGELALVVRAGGEFRCTRCGRDGHSWVVTTA